MDSVVKGEKKLFQNEGNGFSSEGTEEMIPK
jgi:hypothetical protein